MPLPLPMAPTVQVLPPSSNWMAYSFLWVSVVIMAVAASVLPAQWPPALRRRRDSPGKGVNDHGLANDTGGSGQHIRLRGCATRRSPTQRTALLGQSHAVGGAGVGVAAVHKDGLLQARPSQAGHRFQLDGCAADLIGGVNTGGGTAHLRLDECQIVFFIMICADAAMHASRCKTLGAQMPPATS